VTGALHAVAELVHPVLRLSDLQGDAKAPLQMHHQGRSISLHAVQPELLRRALQMGLELVSHPGPQRCRATAWAAEPGCARPDRSPSESSGIGSCGSNQGLQQSSPGVAPQRAAAAPLPSSRSTPLALARPAPTTPAASLRDPPDSGSVVSWRHSQTKGLAIVYLRSS